MEQLIELLSKLGENWQGTILVLVVFSAITSGPIVYVAHRLMGLQEKEGDANRMIQREISAAVTVSIGKLSDAVRKLELALVKADIR
jgi:hypothetical protein